MHATKTGLKYKKYPWKREGGQNMKRTELPVNA